LPAISIDTFFACSLMVLLVLSAMATSSIFLHPYIDSAADLNAPERFRETAKHMLLGKGEPASWGQNRQTIPVRFGLARVDASVPYELDIDKVTRLNGDNAYALDYRQIVAALGMPDTAFRIEIKPFFEVSIDLTATFNQTAETIYRFRISTARNGVAVPSDLKYYAIAQGYLGLGSVNDTNGQIHIDVTLPNSAGGQGLLTVFARACYNEKLVSINTLLFSHNSTTPKPSETYLKLSPLNYTVTAVHQVAELNLSKAYELTFDHNVTLTEIDHNTTSATYSMAHVLDCSPKLLVATGWNATDFFSESVAYPQAPFHVGADFADSTDNMSDVFACVYVVTIESVLYECNVWLGGPRK